MADTGTNDHQGTSGDTTEYKTGKSTGRAQLDDLIHVRCTAAEKEQIRQTAEVGGLTLSQYARKRLIGHRIQSRIELAVLGEMRRQGGLLKHLITTATSGGGPVDANEIRHTLHALEDVYEDVRRSMHKRESE